MPTCIVDSSSPGVLIQRDAHGHFAIAPLGDAPQMECSDFEAAVHHASLVAAMAGADLWYDAGNGRRRPLGDIFTVRRLWNEFIDLPALHLTPQQAKRLMDVDTSTCSSVLTVLVEVGLLQQSENGTYARGSDRHTSIPPLCMTGARGLLQRISR
jgi:hypothetical protein